MLHTRHQNSCLTVTNSSATARVSAPLNRGLPRGPQAVAREWVNGGLNPPLSPPAALQTHDGNLVDPASSHTLVSKIKPCMSKYKHLYRETANGSLYQL